MDSRSWAATPRISSNRATAWSVVTIAIAIVAQPLLSRAQLIQPSSGLINPRAIVFSPATRKVYAVDTGHGAVQIYSEGSKQAHRVQVGAAPVSIAVNLTNGRVYIANAGDGSVTVLDGDSDAAVARIPIGSHPYSIAVNSATGKVYVTHTFGDQLSILDGTTNTASELKTGSSDLIAINSRTGIIYLLGYGGAVKILDGASQKVTERPVGKHAWGLTANDATGGVYVTRIENADIAVLGDTLPGFSSFPAGAIPCAIAVNPKTDTFYVADYGDNTVSVIDATAGRKTATVTVGNHPKAIAFDAESKLVYVANTGDDTVTVIDPANNGVVATLPAGRSPYALAVVPGSSRLYVANEADDNPSTVIDLAGIHKLNP
jgi:YVTN family beta-propeller protein